ncbi:Na(+)/glucose symporter [Piscirickettsia salmonis]|uniref:sodium:solute symporter n=1 Tax=Piscirickettsia salmonis TaxID=1238 RepID=UPI0012BA691B|nr:sodium:solute symporter [Piscirickettsia salmonis]QGO67873.1 Na(+)/glucose symporter [Piscirickettsia salmonis]
MELHNFGWLNYTVLLIYLLSVLSVGIYFAKRQKKADDYFKAGGRIPGWAAGLSIFATTLSSITFMSIPEKSYTADWTFVIAQYVTILMLPLVFIYFIPFFRRLNITSAYEYLEARFDVKMRVFGSLSFMLFHIGRTAIICYLTVISLHSFVHINPYVLLGMIGILCIVYTFLGGIEGVIWTDVIQGILLSAGALMVLIIACLKVKGGVSEAVSVAVAHHKFFSAHDWQFSWTQATVPVLMMGAFFSNLQQYTASQDVVQRYMTTESMQENKRSLITVAKFTAVIPLIFFAIGTVLYVFYQQNPNLLPKGFNSAEILPYFVATQVPAGLSGLIIAAIFAASQSSISSSLNSISACFTTDIKQRLLKPDCSNDDLVTARWVIVIAGMLGVTGAGYLLIANESQVWDAFFSLLGLVGGPVTGLFVLGIFSRRANALSALFGVICAIAALLVARYMSELNFFYYSAIGTLTVVIVGHVLGYLSIPADQQRKVAGNTIFTQ